MNFHDISNINPLRTFEDEDDKATQNYLNHEPIAPPSHYQNPPQKLASSPNINLHLPSQTPVFEETRPLKFDPKPK